MAPRLSDYIQEDDILSLKGSLDQPISGIVMDSRRVIPGALFFALPGLRTDGSAFIDEAIKRGAVAIVGQNMPAHLPGKTTFIQVANPRAMLAKVSRRFYKSPDESMGIIGVTGTNGKTTVACLAKHFLNGTNRIGLLGTVNYDLGLRTVPSFKTTPESVDTFGMLAQMRDAGCKNAVMEISSHGIDQHRIDCIKLEAAVFTNLTQDHLDYHKTMEEYFQVKTRLFTGETGSVPKLSIINTDDPYGKRLLKLLDAKGINTKVITFGENRDAEIRAENISLNFKNSSFTLVWPDGYMQVESPLVSRYNISNLLAAIAALWGMGKDPRDIIPKLASFPGVPGRMERIEEGQAFNVLVDYAHTDDALRNAAGTLRTITPGRLFVVFGCGGNRDRAKRPLMLSAVQQFADFTFVTADNPRSEPLSQIFDDMRKGMSNPNAITWIEDRRRAISLALDMCKPGDCLLIAGKGHETYQEFADTVIPFDDRQVARELIAIKRIASKQS